MLNKLKKTILGYDIFISYSRSDSLDYAYKLAEYYIAKNDEVFIDQISNTKPGEDIPDHVITAIKRSKGFILIGSPGVQLSRERDPIPQEIQAFLDSKGKFLIPINVGGVINTDKVKLKDPTATEIEKKIAGLTLYDESNENFDLKSPSKNILDKIDQALKFTKKNAKLRRWSFVIALLSLVLITFSVVAAVEAKNALENAKYAKKQQKLAEDRTKIADTLAAKASKKADTALRLKELSDNLKNKALVEKSEADGLRRIAVKDADSSKKLATRAKTEAKTALIAKEEAEKLRKKLLYEAMEAGGDRLKESYNNISLMRNTVLSVSNTYAKWPNSGQAIPANLSIALTDADKFQKKQGLPLENFGSYPRIYDFDVSSSGNMLVTIGIARPPKLPMDTTYSATVWDVRTRQSIGDLDDGSAKMTACAISPDSKTVVIGYATGKVKFFSLDEGRPLVKDTVSFPHSIEGAKFTNNGRHILVWANGDVWTGKNLFIYDVLSKEKQSISLSSGFVDFDNGRGFTSLQNSPSFIAGLDWHNQLSIVDINNGTVKKFDLTQGKLLKQIGFSDFETPRIDPSGRWVLLTPFNNKMEKAFLVDLKSMEEKKDIIVYPFPYTKEADLDNPTQKAFSTKGELLLIEQANQKLSIFDLKKLNQELNKPIREIAIGKNFQIRSFLDSGNKVVLTVEAENSNSTTYTPNESKVRIEIYNVDDWSAPDEFSVSHALFGFEVRLKQCLNGAFQVGLVNETICIWERDPTPGFTFSYGMADMGEGLGKATDATISPDGKWVATSHTDGKVAISDLQSRTLVGILSGFKGKDSFIEWMGTNKDYALIAASASGQLIKWTDDNKIEKLNTPEQLKQLSAMQVSADGKTIALTDSSGTVFLLRNNNWKKYPFKNGSITALSKNAQYLAITYRSPDITILNLNSGAATLLKADTSKFHPYVEKLDFAFNDQRLIAKSEFDLSVWDLVTKKELPADTVIDKNTVRIENLWVYVNDDDAILIDTKTGSKVDTVPGRNPFLAGLAISSSPDFFGSFKPDSLFAAATMPSPSAMMPDPEVRVWGFSEKLPTTYSPISMIVRRVEFLPDGKGFLVISPEGFPTIVPTDIELKFQALCPLIWEGFTNEEVKANGYAFKLCWNKFEQFKNSKPFQLGHLWEIDISKDQILPVTMLP